MACKNGMHAPGSEYAHLKEPAGMKTEYGDVFRYNRVTPHYPPDPCIRPNEADLVCPPDDPKPTKNDPRMPAAGYDVRDVAEEFSFYKVRPSRIRNPCREQGPPITQSKPCPCSNRCPVKTRKSYSLHYLYPQCVDRPSSPHFVTPLLCKPSPYVSWPSTAPPPPNPNAQFCRPPHLKHLIGLCPNSAPTVGPQFAMFLKCHKR